MQIRPRRGISHRGRAVVNVATLLAELRRRNVLRAAVLYAGAIWALAQGIAQLGPSFGAPDWVTRWFVIAGAIGFPFWLAFAWFYEFTPQGLKRESEIDPTDSVARSTGRKLDFWIIGVLTVAVVLLLTDRLVLHKDAPKAIAASASAKSIAVLPFENLSADKDNAYFVAGMQDLILTKLADIGDLKVISRTSTEKYQSHPDNLKDIAQQLGVATILEGSVQKAGNQVLINVQLIDASSDAHIWAQAYPRTLDNIFGVEGEVAEKIAAALKAKLSPAETAQLAAVPTENKAAYDLFLRAEFQANRGTTDYDTASWKAAIPLYRQAITNDPDFALAWARLSYTESELAWFGGGGLNAKQLTQQARTDAERALALAPDLAAAQLAIGYSDYYGRGDYAAALKAFAAALAQRPNDVDALAARGFVQRRQGRFDDAIASFKQALAHDPRNSGLANELGETNLETSRFADAETWFQRALALDPDNLTARIFNANSILFRTGDVALALAAAQGDAPILKQQRVILLTYQRKYREALTLLDSVPDTPDNFSITSGSKALQMANLYRLAGDATRAQPLFEKALVQARAHLEMQQGINMAFVWNNLASAELGLGHTAAAVATVPKILANRAWIEDPTYGPELMETCAVLYAEAHRADLAVPLLAKALASPGVGFNYSPVLLWIDPAWDPIRTDPRFQALLQQYAHAQPAHASSGAAHE